MNYLIKMSINKKKNINLLFHRLYKITEENMNFEDVHIDLFKFTLDSILDYNKSISENKFDYTITFDFTMPDTNYALVGAGSANGGNGGLGVNTSSGTPLLYSTTQIRFVNFNGNTGAKLDGGAIGVAVIR